MRVLFLHERSRSIDSSHPRARRRFAARFAGNKSVVRPGFFRELLRSSFSDFLSKLRVLSAGENGAKDGRLVYEEKARGRIFCSLNESETERSRQGESEEDDFFIPS